jgi:hypothetical protein
MSKGYLQAFFEEKKISYQLFEIKDANGYVHLIDTNFVIDAIFNSTIKEQQIISLTLRKLDYFNQPITDYLKFLATALVKDLNRWLKNKCFSSRINTNRLS